MGASIHETNSTNNILILVQQIYKIKCDIFHIHKQILTSASDTKSQIIRLY